jgi:hypothetical protein
VNNNQCKKQKSSAAWNEFGDQSQPAETITLKQLPSVNPLYHFESIKQNGLKADTVDLCDDSILAEFKSKSISQTHIQQSALCLHHMGFNVLPIPRVGGEYDGKKPPYGSYSMLFYVRLPFSSLPQLFESSNLAIICGRLSMDLFVLDCDTEESFQWVMDQLSRRNIETWIDKTPRGGHFWFLSKDGEVTNHKFHEEIDVIGNRKYFVAPPSVHPTGELYYWYQRLGQLPCSVHLDQLAFIDGLKSSNGRNQADLPSKAHQVLVEGNTEAFASNSEAEFSAVMSLAKAGYSEDEIIDLFEIYSPPHYSGKKDSQDWLKRYVLSTVFSITEEDFLPVPAKDASCHSNNPWPGRTGETDKRVYASLLTRARLERSVVFRASVRELAELSNVSKDTVCRSLGRLCHSGYIKRMGRDATSGACTYSLLK